MIINNKMKVEITEVARSTMFSIKSLFIVLWISVGISADLSAVSHNYADKPSPMDGLVMTDMIYKESIHSIRVNLDGSPISPPFKELHSATQFLVTFDDLAGGFADYYYTLIHCNPWWEPSDLETTEYIKGFPENNITDYEQSFNTSIDYKHYSFKFPNDMCQLTRSGNYLLYVFEDGDQELPVFSSRLVIFEPLVAVTARVHESSIIGERRYQQEVDFSIDHQNFEIPNPYEDLAVAVLQNNRWDNAKLDLEPRFVMDRELDFDYGEPNNFMGNNEFRELDLKNFKFITLRVDSTIQKPDGFHTWVKKDPMRTFTQYRTVRDINGKFLPFNDNGFDSDLEADYSYCHFTLPFEIPLSNVDFYVFGSISQWNCSEKFKLHYDYELHTYTATILLKQGYYNYAYAAVKKGEGSIDLTVAEGNHAEAENEYQIFVYNYDIAKDYYRVIGAYFTNSFNNQ
jgi:hypothetical protein